MQTFLPLDSFKDSALVLDNKRLGKQRVECKQILRALRGETKGWVNHPATRMWRGYEQSLCRYAIVICETWIARDKNDSLLPYFQEMIERLPNVGDPTWFGGEIHASHRSNLLRKDPIWYGQFGWKEPNDLPYVWPV